MADLAKLINHYYGHPAVTERMLEFFGQSSTDDATAIYVSGTDGNPDPDAFESLAATRLNELLGRGYEIGRSLWDRKFLIADLDIDYENFDSPAEPYIDSGRTYRILQPVVDAALDVLGANGIRPLHLIGGRGHHLVWAIRHDSTAFSQLARLGHIPPSLMALYNRKSIEFGQDIHPCLARAFAGMGMLLEFTAHRILSLAAPSCPVPIQLTAVEVGPSAGRREIVSLDISEYGDPLHLRHIRVPFSVYLKPRQLSWCLGEDGVRQLLPWFEIPLEGISMDEAVRARHDPEAALDLAARSSVHIPDESEGSFNLITEYNRSELARFHHFYSRQMETAGRAESASAIRGADAGALPPCTRWILDHPNDWLLKPGGVQHVTRTLTALAWPPRQIADLIRLRYEGEFGWSNRWLRYDAAYRAMFYVRLFSGLIATGQDRLIDFNCVSNREKGYCTVGECNWNLIPYQQALITRRQHGRLDHRSVDRLLLEGKDL